MRVGVDFRLLSRDRGELNRGIARFVQDQVQALLACDDGNEYVVLCAPDLHRSAVRPELLAAPNARLVCAPATAYPTRDRRAQLARFSEYQQWLHTLRLDLYHATSPMWSSEPHFPGFDVCPYVATAYDLIPMLYPAQYLWSSADSDDYEYRLAFLQQATRIAAISHATRKDLVEHAGVAAERIDVTYPAVSSCFRPLPPLVTRAILASFDHPSRRLSRRRVAIPEQYLMCIAGMHYTKNLGTLLSAYAALPQTVRTSLPLVVAGNAGSSESDGLVRRGERLGIGGDLVLTGQVSDDELAALYNGATLLVHPAHHEGFGLPVAESMRCGTAVITTQRSALPEVAGDAAVLVDSDDAAGFTAAILELVNNPELRSELARRGTSNAARFTAGALADATRACHSATASPSPAPGTAAVRVAVWSPVPPQYSGISDYTDDLVTALASEPGLELEIFVDDDVRPTAQLMRTTRVHHSSDFDRCMQRSPFDVTIYQLGASPFHLYMQKAMLSHPGAVVLHDLQWSRALLVDFLRNGLGAQEFRAELALLEGEHAAREWDRLHRRTTPAHPGAEREFLDHQLMLGRIADASRCFVALTPEIASELKHRYPRARAGVIPMGVRDPERDGFGCDRATARGYLAVDTDAFLVVVLGIADPAKHIDSALDAFAALRQTGVLAELAIVGEIPDAGYEAELHEHAVRLDVSDSVKVTGRVSRAVFEAYTAACDAVIALRDPGLRQMSAVVMRALAAGRCVIMSELPALRSIPDDVCIRVAAPPAETAEVTAALIALARDRDQRAELERRARAHYEATAQLQPMVDKYVSLIEQLSGRPVTRRAAGLPAPSKGRGGRPAARTGALPYNKACELEDFAHKDLRDVISEVCVQQRAVFGAGYPLGAEHRRDWEAAMAVRTLADFGALRPDSRILGVSSGSDHAESYLVRRVASVAALDLSVDSEHDPRLLAFPDQSFDGVFSSGVIQDLVDLESIAAAAYEMGRVLKPGGVLALSTAMLTAPESSNGSVVRNGRALLSPGDLRRYIVEASGLEPVDNLDTEVSHSTLATRRDIGMSSPTSETSRPFIVTASGGTSWTSVHIALRRAPVHPSRDNSWARPSALPPAGLSSADGAALQGRAPARDTLQPGDVSLASVSRELRDVAEAHETARKRLEALRAAVDVATGMLETALQDASTPRAGVFRAELYGRPPRAFPPPAPAAERTDDVVPAPPESAVPIAVTPPVAAPYTVVVDPTANDLITAAYLAGFGSTLNLPVLSVIDALVPPRGTVLDIGANIGGISLPLAVSGRRVIAVEAAPINAALLRAGVAVNRVMDRTRVIESAVGDHEGEASFAPRGAHGQLVEAGLSGAVTVHLRTVDSLLAEEAIEQIDLVKIDVEGAEVAVLRGMQQLLRAESRPLVIVECSPHTLAAFGTTAAELIRMLEDLGYTAYTIDDHRLIRRHAYEIQANAGTDVLATARGIPRVPGWRIEPPMSLNELVRRLYHEALSYSADARAYAARAARDLHPDVVARADVTAVMALLRSDPDQDVRAAAAWWHEERQT